MVQIDLVAQEQMQLMPDTVPSQVQQGPMHVQKQACHDGKP